jgi:hypothetical protein
VGATQKALAKAGWSVADVDLWEVNEAFAVVPMALMNELKLPHEIVNVNGGACALGHPIGASGARIMVTLIHALKARGLKRGLATLCIGGGEATAMLALQEQEMIRDRPCATSLCAGAPGALRRGMGPQGTFPREALKPNSPNSAPSAWRCPRVGRRRHGLRLAGARAGRDRRRRRRHLDHRQRAELAALRHPNSLRHATRRRKPGSSRWPAARSSAASA